MDPLPSSRLRLLPLSCWALLLVVCAIAFVGVQAGHYGHHRGGHHEEKYDDEGSAAGCPYFTPSQSGRSAGLSAYDVSPALEKLRYVFANLRLNSTTASLVPLSEGLIFKESMDPTVHYQSDFMPRGRRKAVHGDGVVCQVTLEIDEDNDDNPYTGILRTGSTTAILRLSSTVDPSAVGGPVPSVAIKFFRDGAMSANVVLLYSQAPQTESSNPFARPMTNQFVGQPANLVKKFGTVTSYPNFTGISSLAYVSDPDEEQIHFPWQLVFVPNPVIQRMLPLFYPYSNSAEYYQQLLPPLFDPSDLPLYFVYAVDLPTSTSSVYLGLVRAVTPFLRSDFGDRRLFFKHTTTEEDIQFRPVLGRLCRHAAEGCGPCPQTRECLNEHWAERVDMLGPYAGCYDPIMRSGYANVAPAVAKAFGSPLHPGVTAFNDTE